MDSAQNERRARMLEKVRKSAACMDGYRTAWAAAWAAQEKTNAKIIRKWLKK